MLVAQSCPPLWPHGLEQPGPFVHGFSRQGCWCGLLFPPPEAFPIQGWTCLVLYCLSRQVVTCPFRYRCLTHWSHVLGSLASAWKFLLYNVTCHTASVSYVQIDDRDQKFWSGSPVRSGPPFPSLSPLLFSSLSPIIVSLSCLFLPPLSKNEKKNRGLNVESWGSATY